MSEYEDANGKYTYNPENGVLRIISVGGDVAKSICDQMTETTLFPDDFTISAIVLSTKKGDFLTKLIVGNEIKKFLNSGTKRKEYKGKPFSEILKQQTKRTIKSNIIIYDQSHNRFLFQKGEIPETVYPISIEFEIKDVPSVKMKECIKTAGIRSDKYTKLWTYHTDDLKAYNVLVVVGDKFVPKTSQTGLEWVWVYSEDIHTVGTSPDVVALFNIEEKLHKLIDQKVNEKKDIDYTNIVNTILD